MKDRIFKNILQVGLGAVMVFAPLARGAVRPWSITIVELTVAFLVFLWLWRVNNSKQYGVGSKQYGVGSKQYGVGSKQYGVGSIRRTKIDLAIWSFVALAVVSCVFSIYRYASFLAMLRLLTMVGVFYLVVNNFGRPLSLRLAVLVIIMGTAMSLLGLAQYFFGLEHSWWKPAEFLASTYVNHNHFAGYLELALPLAIALLLAGSWKLEAGSYKLLVRPALIAAVVIMFTALVFSQSRGAWVCMAISLLVMNITLVKKKRLSKESLLIFLLLLALGAAYIYGGYDAVARRLQTVKELNQENFFKGRESIWQGSIAMIKARPLYGTGIGTFVWGFPRYRPPDLNVRADYAHNDYLQMMAEIGVFALPLLLWMVWVVVAAGVEFELTDGVRLGSAIGILSLALHALVDFNFHIPANLLVVACLAGIIMRRTQVVGGRTQVVG